MPLVKLLTMFPPAMRGKGYFKIKKLVRKKIRELENLVICLHSDENNENSIVEHFKKSSGNSGYKIENLSVFSPVSSHQLLSIQFKCVKRTRRANSFRKEDVSDAITQCYFYFRMKDYFRRSIYF